MSHVRGHAAHAAFQARCRELLWTVPGVTPNEGGSDQGLDAADPAIWHRDPSEGRVTLASRTKQSGKIVLLSHAWDEPASWSKWFGAQAYTEVKQAQVTEAMRGMLQRLMRESQGGEDTSFQVWVDHSCLPQVIDDSDHPSTSSSSGFGPYKIQVKSLKAMLPDSQDGGFYSMLTVPAEGFEFQGVLQSCGSSSMVEVPTTDKQEDEEHDTETVEWKLMPGQYFFTAARSLSTGDGSPLDRACVADDFKVGHGDISNWCTRRSLDDEAWIQFELASVRTLCRALFDSMFTLHSHLVPIVTWNYFDRLWPLTEWAIFCSRVGVNKVHLAADFFTKPALVEFHRALGRLSIERAQCHDPGDRVLLLKLLEKEFACSARYVTPCFKKVTKGVLMAVKERTVDFEPLERYVRATAIALFAKQAALTASRRLKCDDESGWISLADSFGLSELHCALKRCKCWEWYQVAEAAAAESQPADNLAACVEMAYQAAVEAWWTDSILPVMEDERRRAIRPAPAMAAC